MLTKSITFRIPLFSLLLILVACENLTKANFKGRIEATYRVAGIEPAAAPPGTEVIISGSGFTSTTIESITLGEISVIANNIDDENIYLKVPESEPGISSFKLLINGEISKIPFVVLNANWSMPGPVPGAETEETSKKIAASGEHPTLGTFIILEPMGFENNPTPVIRWQGTTNAASYTIQIGKDEACTEVVQTFENVRTTEKILQTLVQGSYYSCVKAKDYLGNELNASNNGLAFVLDLTAPLAAVQTPPDPVIGNKIVSLRVIGSEVIEYRYKFGLAAPNVCQDTGGYGAASPVATLLNIDMTLLPDGDFAICLVGADAAGNYQPFSAATSLTWIKDTTPPANVTLTGTPANTAIAQIGFAVNFPVNTADFEKIEIWGNQSATAPDCGTGTLLESRTSFAAPIIIGKDLPVDTEYSVRICSFDLIGNRNDTIILENLKSTIGQTIFLTSATYDGNLAGEFDGKTFTTGIEGADYRCQYSAQQAGLSGSWHALISDRSISTREFVRITGRVHVNRLTNKDVAQDTYSLYDLQLEYGFNYNEFGKLVNSDTEPVWTGSSGGGYSNGNSCNAWTSNAAARMGYYGRTTKKIYEWMSKGQKNCDTKAHLYCINEPAPAVAKLPTFTAAIVSGYDVTIDIKFPADMSQVYIVKLFRQYGNRTDHNCYDYFPDTNLLKNYDGGAVPFVDEVIPLTVSPGVTYFVACMMDNSYRIIHRQLSVSLFVGIAQHHTIFVTSADYDGTFNGNPGLAGADSKCQLHGATINNTTWKALLSSSVVNARDRISVTNPVLNSLGQIVALDHTDLFDGSVIYKVGYSELQDDRYVAWTGSSSTGTSNMTCGDWTDINQSATYGYQYYTNDSWINYSSYQCLYSLPIICIDQQP